MTRQEAIDCGVFGFWWLFAATTCWGCPISSIHGNSTHVVCVIPMRRLLRITILLVCVLSEFRRIVCRRRRRHICLGSRRCRWGSAFAASKLVARRQRVWRKKSLLLYSTLLYSAKITHSSNHTTTTTTTRQDETNCDAALEGGHRCAGRSFLVSLLF